MAIFITRDLTHWSAWGDLMFIWKQKYSLPAGGNCFVLCNSTCAIDSVVFNGVKIGGIDVARKLQFYFCGVTHDWMSSVFEVLFLF